MFIFGPFRTNLLACLFQAWYRVGALRATQSPRQFIESEAMLKVYRAQIAQLDIGAESLPNRLDSSAELRNRRRRRLGEEEEEKEEGGAGADAKY